MGKERKVTGPKRGVVWTLKPEQVESGWLSSFNRGRSFSGLSCDEIGHVRVSVFLYIFFFLFPDYIRLDRKTESYHKKDRKTEVQKKDIKTEYSAIFSKKIKCNITSMSSFKFKLRFIYLDLRKTNSTSFSIIFTFSQVSAS